MSDHADIVREALNFTPDVVGNKPTRKDLAYRALDALVAERDASNASVKSSGEFWLERVKAAEAERDAFASVVVDAESRAQAAEDEVARLREALTATKAWLDQEEEVGLGVPDVLWDIILAALAPKEGT